MTDIRKLKVEKLLEGLGVGDWIIPITDEIPDLEMTVQHREAYWEIAGKLFVRWVIKGIDRIHTHDDDPPWDHSGSIRNKQADPMILLTRHTSLKDWAETEYTGNSTASYESGYGLYWDTFDKEITSLIEEKLYDLAREHSRPYLNVDDDQEVWEDPDFEEVEYVIMLLGFALNKEALQTSTSEAWRRYEGLVRVEIEVERRKAEEWAERSQRVSEFWRQHFPDLLDMRRIDAPLFEAMNLEHRIAEVLADADPEIVRLITEHRLPGSYSNSVTEHIKNIARRALV